MVAGATCHDDESVCAQKKEEGMGNLVRSFAVEGHDEAAGNEEEGGGGVRVYISGGVPVVFQRWKCAHEVEHGPTKILVYTTLSEIDGWWRNQWRGGSGIAAKIFKSRRSEGSRGLGLLGLHK